MPSLPRLPAVGDVLGLLKAQTDALTELPATVMSLQRAARSLGDTVAAGAETLAVLRRVAERAEQILDELDEPLRALAPGLQRAAAVLEDPVVETIPDTVRSLQAEVLPLLRTLGETQARLATLPGAALLGQLTGRVAARPMPAGDNSVRTQPPPPPPPSR